MNPLKCAFGLTSGKFLGFIVIHRGIEVDPQKIKAILEMPPPKNLKEFQSLQGRLAYIIRFISNLSGRIHPFSRLMKKGVDSIKALAMVLLIKHFLTLLLPLTRHQSQPLKANQFQVLDLNQPSRT